MLAVADMDDGLTTIDISRKVWDAVPLSVGGAGSPSNTMWPELRPTSVPSGILIHPTVWPQYNDVTDRTGQDRHRSDSIGRTVLQAVAQLTCAQEVTSSQLGG